tara:strand:- start:61 stop:624 length:564 start_codon:yes stop_codon:yes gene_type:complete
MRPIKTYEYGGKSKPEHKGKRSVSRTKLKAIKNRQIAPFESLLRGIVAKQELKKGESKGDSISSEGVDFNSGSEGESCREVDGKTVCGAYGYDQGDAADSGSEKDRDKKSIALILADLISERRDGRQSSLENRMKNVTRRELYSKNKQFGMRNPFARARYRSLQKKLARSEGRENAAKFIDLGTQEF